MPERLVPLGLNDDAAQLYLVLLELGGGYASQLAKRLGRNRSTTYHTVNKLVEKGLATRLRKGRYQYFAAEPPERIVQLAKMRFDRASDLLPELLSIQNTLARKPKIQFFERTSGIEEIFEQTLSAEGEILGYTNRA